MFNGKGKCCVEGEEMYRNWIMNFLMMIESLWDFAKHPPYLAEYALEEIGVGGANQT